MSQCESFWLEFEILSQDESENNRIIGQPVTCDFKNNRSDLDDWLVIF
jgi:hypothetical protein